LSAAAWCAELGFSAVLVERESDIGGQLKIIYGPIENYLGRWASNGDEMLSYFRESVENSGFVRKLGRGAVSIDLSSRSLLIAGGEQIEFRCLIVATGVRRRKLGVPGEEEFRGRGIIESGMRDRDRVAGKNVIIVGGGDAAIENALILSESAASVTVVHRRSEFTAREDLSGELKDRNNVVLLVESVVTQITGNAEVTGVEVSNVSSGLVHHLPADAVLIRIGVEPNSDVVRGVLELDARGYITVNGRCETSVAGIFAVGDVANPVSPTLSTAAGTGATAAKACADWLKDA
jgi:thioredoxin reductase (NADPH)